MNLAAAPAEKSYRAANAAVLVTALSFLSPVAGLAVEISLAWKYGASGTVDAFRIAYLLIGFGSQIFVGYLLPHLVVPLIAERRANGREEDGWRLAISFGQLLAAAGLLFAAFVIVNPGPVCDILGPGLAGSARADALLMLRFFAVALAIVLWCGVITGILYLHGIFALSPFSQVICNLSLALGVLLIPASGSLAVAVGLTSGFAVMLFLHVRALARVSEQAGIRLSSVFRLSPWGEIGRLFLRGLPLLVIVVTIMWGYAAINSAMSRLPTGNLARYGYASKFMVVIIYASAGLTTVMFPALSKAAAARDSVKFSSLTARSIRMVLLITTPLTVIAYALREPMVRLMFDHGALGQAGVEDVSQMVAVLLWQAIPGNMNFLLLKVCFAQDDTRWPAAMSAISNLLLYLGMPLGMRGGAAGILVVLDMVQWGIMISLLYHVMKVYGVRVSPVFSLKTVALAAVAGVPAFFAHWLFRERETAGMLSHFAELAVGGVLTAPVVIFAARAFSFAEAREIAEYAGAQVRRFLSKA